MVDAGAMAEAGTIDSTVGDRTGTLHLSRGGSVVQGLRDSGLGCRVRAFGV